MKNIFYVLSFLLILLLGLLLLPMFMMAAPAHSQSAMCGPYKEFVTAIQGSQYGESSIGKGLSGGGQVVIEIFVGKETFTILATTPATGRTCIIGAGKSWIAEEPGKSGEDL